MYILDYHSHNAYILWISLRLLLLICISLELAEMIYNKVEKKEVLGLANIHQELKTHEIKGKIMLEEEKLGTNPYE